MKSTIRTIRSIQLQDVVSDVSPDPPRTASFKAPSQTRPERKRLRNMDPITRGDWALCESGPQQRRRNHDGNGNNNATEHADYAESDDDSQDSTASSHTVDCTVDDDRTNDLACHWCGNLTLQPRCATCNIKSCKYCVKCHCEASPERERPTAKPAPSAGVLPRFWRRPQDTQQNTLCNIQDTTTTELISNPVLQESPSAASTPRALPGRQEQQ